MKLSNDITRVALRPLVVLFAVLLWWVFTSLQIFPPILFPSPDAVLVKFQSMVTGSGTDNLFVRLTITLRYLIFGIALAVSIATVASAIAVSIPFGGIVLETVYALMSPLPVIALVPLFILWFGLGDLTMIIAVATTSVWPILMNTYTGFRSVSPIFLQIGRNVGMSSGQMIRYVILPSAFPYFLSGSRAGWAYGWRTAVAAEMIFGVTGVGGIGFLVYNYSSRMDIAGVFASLISIVILGFVVERVLFGSLESRTVVKWGITR